MTPLVYEVPTVVKFIGTESTMVVARGWGRGVQEVISVLEDEKVLHVSM